MKKEDLQEVLCIKNGKVLRKQDVGEEVELALETVAKGFAVEMVVGPRLPSKDFYVLANLVEKYSKLVHIYFRKTSPTYHSGMIGRNVYFNNLTHGDEDYSVTKVIENGANGLKERYIELFNKHKPVSTLATPELLRKVAQVKEKKEQAEKMEREK